MRDGAGCAPGRGVSVIDGNIIAGIAGAVLRL